MEKKFHFKVQEKEVIIERKFNSSKEELWNSFTNYKILDQWWAPKPWKCHTKDQQFKVSGRWLYYMEGPNAEVHWSYLDYTEIDAKNSFSGVDGFCDEDEKTLKDQPTSKWKVEFKDDGDSCSVITSCRFDKEESLKALIDMGFLQGYEMGLNNLEELLKK